MYKMEFELQDDSFVSYLDGIFARQNMYREGGTANSLVYVGKNPQETFTGMGIATLSLKRNRAFLDKCTKWLWLEYRNEKLYSAADGLARYKTW